MPNLSKDRLEHNFIDDVVKKKFTIWPRERWERDDMTMACLLLTGKFAMGFIFKVISWISQLIRFQ